MKVATTFRIRVTYASSASDSIAHSLSRIAGRSLGSAATSSRKVDAACGRWSIATVSIFWMASGRDLNSLFLATSAPDDGDGPVKLERQSQQDASTEGLSVRTVDVRQMNGEPTE